MDPVSKILLSRSCWSDGFRWSFPHVLKIGFIRVSVCAMSDFFHRFGYVRKSPLFCSDVLVPSCFTRRGLIRFDCECVCQWVSEPVLTDDVTDATRGAVRKSTRIDESNYGSNLCMNLFSVPAVQASLMAIDRTRLSLFCACSCLGPSKSSPKSSSSSQTFTQTIHVKLLYRTRHSNRSARWWNILKFSTDFLIKSGGGG